MVACTAQLYEHQNYTGRVWKLNKTYNNVETAGLGRNWVSSYKLTGDCDDKIVMACRHDQNHSNGEDCFYLQKGQDNNDMHHRRKYWDNNWGDEIDSIVFKDVPKTGATFKYDIDQIRYTPASPGDTYCGGCRLWPQVKDRKDPKKITKRVWLDDDPENKSSQGVNPCPGAWSKYFTSGKGVRCFYKNNEQAMRDLHASKDDHPKISRMYDTIVRQFCADPENLLKSPDGTNKCRDIGNSNDLSRSYCKKGARIKPKALGGDDACDKKQINNDSLWEELATDFCKVNKGDAWCACHNASSGVCDEDESAAGCTKVMEEHNAIIDSLPPSKIGTQALKGLNVRKNCRAGVCNGTVFRPSNLNDCDLNIDLCIQEVNVAGHVVDTGINMKCEKKDIEEGGGKGEVDREETETEQLERLRKENPDSSEEEIKQMAKLENKNKKKKKKSSPLVEYWHFIAGGGSFLLMCCCMVVLVLALA